MRLPPNYGCLVQLKGNRRNPLGVRVMVGKKVVDGREKPIYKYIGYFPLTTQGRKQALQLLADYHSGRNSSKYEATDTFLVLATEWIDRHEQKLEQQGCQNSYETMKIYRGLLSKTSTINERKIDKITYTDVQAIADSISSMSSATVLKVKALCNGAFELARKKKFIEENFVPDVDFYYSKNKQIHKPFTDEEIDILWKNKENAIIKVCLILIYSGMRYGELLKIKTEHVHLDERYMVGGLKTTSGRNRLIPIAEKIVPLIEYFMSDKEYLVDMPYNTFDYYFVNELKKLGMEHLAHDTRYTTATLLDRVGANPNCIKDILGHAREGVTNRVYVKKDMVDLLSEINKI